MIIIINVLVIGNSFSEDSTHYLYQICSENQIETKVVNLYVPGCSLKQHWEYIKSEQQIYRYELNGYYDTKIADLPNYLVSSKDVILEELWDHVVIQQASHYSGVKESYFPYAEMIVGYLKGNLPRAKIWIQETWAYEEGSTHSAFSLYDNQQEIMYNKLTSCYLEVSQMLDISIIKTGTAVQMARKKDVFNTYTNTKGESITRDGYHLSYDYGRYLASMMMANNLFEIDPLVCEYVPTTPFLPNNNIDENKLTVIKDVVSLLWLEKPN